MKPMPRTYFDGLSITMPEVLDGVRADCVYLRNHGMDAEPVRTVDAFPSAALDTAKQYFGRMAEHMGPQMGVHPSQFLSLIAQHDPSRLEMLAGNLNYAYHASLNFELFGRKIFYFQDPLVDRLVATQLTSDSDFLRLPFKSCAFVFTARSATEALTLFVANKNGQPVSPHYDLPITVSISEIGKPEVGEGARTLVFNCWQGHGKNLGAMIKRQILVQPGLSLEDSLRTDWEKIHPGGQDNPFRGMVYDDESGARPVADAVFYEDGLLWMRLLVNAVLYLSSADPDVIARVSPHNQHEYPSTQARTKLTRKEKAHQSPLDYASVGESLPPLQIDKTAMAGEPTSASTLRALDHRVQVRGHWKHQAHGAGHLLRKLIWIKPYERGPDAAELISRAYVVQ